jgi:hypothetical protein
MNREQWLNAAADKINTVVFAPHDVKAVNFRVSVGFPGGQKGAKNSAIGQCWSPSTSAGNITEMFISPILGLEVGSSDPEYGGDHGVLDTLVHEMDHCIVGTECGHKGPFKRLAVKIGLVGKMTATQAGPELASQLRSIATELGPYPHDEITPEPIVAKKGSRLVKIACPGCENVARQARTTYDRYGLICGACNIPMLADS